MARGRTPRRVPSYIFPFLIILSGPNKKLDSFCTILYNNILVLGPGNLEALDSDNYRGLVLPCVATAFSHKFILPGCHSGSSLDIKKRKNSYLPCKAMALTTSMCYIYYNIDAHVSSHFTEKLSQPSVRYDVTVIVIAYWALRLYICTDIVPSSSNLVIIFNTSHGNFLKDKASILVNFFPTTPFPCNMMNWKCYDLTPSVIIFLLAARGHRDRNSGPVPS